MSAISDLINRLKAAVESGSQYPRYVKTNTYNPRPRRTGSKHSGGGSLPRHWRKTKRARRKAQKLARRKQR